MPDQSSDDGFVTNASQTADGSYSITKFYTASSDAKHGKSSTMRLNIPKTIQAEFAALVASKQIPEFRTKEDVVRNCLVHGLKAVLSNIPQLMEADRQLMVWAELEDARERARHNRRTIDSAADLVREAHSVSEKARAKAVIEAALTNPDLDEEVRETLRSLSFRIY